MCNIRDREYFTFGDTRAVLIKDINLIMEPNIFLRIFPIEASRYKFIYKLILLFTREAVRSIALDKVFVKQSFHNFIVKHGFRCDRLNTKKR